MVTSTQLVPPTGQSVGQLPAFTNGVATVSPYADQFGAGADFSRLNLTALNDLTLTNGMTAGYGDGDGHVDNPPAHPGTYGGNKDWAPRRIGVLRSVPNTSDNNYSLYFIFNPNQVNVDFGISFGQIPASYLFTPNSQTGAGGFNGPQTVGAGAPALANTQSVSWTLVFDRTYDLIYGNPSGEGAGNANVNRGVLRDVAALYNLLGSFYGGGGQPVSTPLQVAFSQTATGDIWGFTGFISRVSITYGVFKWDMIPAKCSIDLTMTTVNIGPQVSTTDVGSSGQGASAGGGNPALSPNGNKSARAGATADATQGQGPPTIPGGASPSPAGTGSPPFVPGPQPAGSNPPIIPGGSPSTSTNKPPFGPVRGHPVKLPF